jgi:hypothetical protein
MMRPVRSMMLMAAITLVTACAAPGSSSPTTVLDPVETTVRPTTSTSAASPSPSSSVAATEPCSSGPVEEPHSIVAFYALCSDSPFVPYPVFRPGSAQPDLHQAVTALVMGTTTLERASGVVTSFDTMLEPGETVVRASIGTDGVAQLEFIRDGAVWLPDTADWTSDQLIGLLDPLYATVFSISEVDGLDMSTLCMEQIACDQVMTRVQWEGMLFTNGGVLSTSGCNPLHAWLYPDTCTVDGIVAGGGESAVVTGIETDDVLRMRSGPGVEYFQIGDLVPGASVTATPEAAVADDGGTWRLVATSDGDAGWVNQAFLDIDRTDAELIADGFVEFAEHPTDASFAALPLSDMVELGLGPNVIATFPRGELRRPDAWWLELEHFRAYSGPFSALEVLDRFGVYEVIEGEHPHCAGPPVQAPEGFESFERISVQPKPGTYDSCLQWATVDLFVDEDGLVVAITLDLWEP